MENQDDLDDIVALMELDCMTDDEDEVSEENKQQLKVKTKGISRENEDEVFLGKISEFSQKLTPSTSKKDKSLSKIKKKKSSTIHNGDTDSSDDEHNRDYQNSKYNEYGQDIKYLLSDQTASTNFVRDLSSWKQKRVAPELSVKSKQSTLNFPKQKSDIYTDPFFGIRISKPLISSVVLQEHMNGRTSISMSKVKQFVTKNNVTEDWVIAGALVGKSPVKTSQKGNQFIIWTLSDLRDDLKTVALFLFGNAYKELWKTTVGTVLGVLNPNIMDQREGMKDQASLSVDVAQRVMILGQSKDYGICKSKKKNGEPCTAFVNTNISEYCLYHIKQEYQKLSKRSELQSTFAGRGLTALRNKVLGKNEVFYAGKSYMSIPAKKSEKQVQRDNHLLKSLSEFNKSGIVTSQSVGSSKMKAAETLDVSRTQRAKDLQLLRKLNGEKELTAIEKEIEVRKKINKALNIDKALLHAEDILKDMEKLENSHKIILNKNGEKNNKTKEFDFLNNQPSTSQNNINLSTKFTEQAATSKSIRTSLNKSFDSARPSSTSNTPELSNFGTEIDLNSSISKTMPRFNKNDLNSVKVEKNKTSLENNNLNNGGDKSLINNSAYFKKLGTPKLSTFKNFDLSSPISKTRAVHIDKAKLNALKYVQKNGPLKKGEEKKSKKGVKRFLEETSDDLQEKKTKLADEKFTSQRFKQMMAIQSKHSSLLEEEDKEKEEKYFKKLEVKEKMEEKMMTIFKIDCKAVKCLTCKYTSFSASDRCKQERHVLKVFDSVKRFFKCAKCGNRTVSLEIIPLISCTNCGGSKWERTTMMKEKTAHVGETLSIRGLEEKYIGAVNTGGNINLLVPEDE